MSTRKHRSEKPYEKEEFKYCKHESAIAYIGSINIFNTNYLLSVGSDGECYIHNMLKHKLLTEISLKYKKHN